MTTAATPIPSAPAAPVRRAPPLRERGSIRHDVLRIARWRLKGIAKVVGDVEVSAGDLDGTLVVGGKLTAGRLRAFGRLEVRGPVTVPGSLRTRGTFRAGGPVRAGAAFLVGSCDAAGALEVQGELRCRGSLRAPEVRADTIALEGTAEVRHLVAVRALTARFSGDARLGQLEARDVRLRGPVPNLVTEALGRTYIVSAERIEAATVYVQAARVGFVRAPTIVLGRYAHVVEHEGTIARAHPTSRLGPESWTPPPPGLRR